MGYVDGSKPQPSAIDASHPFWHRQDQLLRLAIITSLDPSLVTHVSHSKTSRAAWLVLESLYANRSRSRVLVLKERLQLQTRGAKLFAEFLHGIKAIADELAMIDQPLSNKDLTLHVPNGLGSEFKEFTASVRTWDIAFSFEELFDRLVAYEEYLK